MPTQSWSHLKPHLQRLEKEKLVQILGDLYKLNADNKVFLATRFLATTPEEMAEPYRKIIRQVFNPDGRGHPSLQLGVARKALNDFKKACADPVAVIDFMLFYVEQGVLCTNTYGDIDAPFYDSLLSVYVKATDLVEEIDDPEVFEPLHARFLTIIRDTRDIGWSFHDGIVEASMAILEAEWE
ncbi:MAG: hypothetical protein KBG20_13450 [Caldilineaceae bacterium]|nr:hypothetical protein [Caldilineaceae bacterium]MBP8123414.1 hypothetical protein [Caldilineaceae bacterium]MBP9073304.1 hypothetical protein [Caldilineaceae bacterium]